MAVNKYLINKIIIILVFVGFAGLAFYFSFQSPELQPSSGNDNEPEPSISDKIDEYIWKKYRDKERNNDPKNTTVRKPGSGSCYDASYLNQIENLRQIQINFIAGQKFFSGPSKLIASSNNDKKINELASQLEKLMESNDQYTYQDILLKFSDLRKELSRKLYIENSQNSFLRKSLGKIVTIEKVGDAALEEGGVNATLEASSRLLNDKKIKEAYIELNTNLDGEYKELAGNWLSYVKRYLDITDDINQLSDYITSESYATKFYKECR